VPDERDEDETNEQPEKVFHGRVSSTAKRETREHVAPLAGIPRRRSRISKSQKGQVYSPSCAPSILLAPNEGAPSWRNRLLL
jgi:hypothetical protein